MNTWVVWVWKDDRTHQLLLNSYEEAVRRAKQELESGNAVKIIPPGKGPWA